MMVKAVDGGQANQVKASFVTNPNYLKYLADLESGESRATRLLSSFLTQSRRQKIDEVVSARTNHFVPILENIYDRGNISAVFRSSEGLGFQEIHLIESVRSKVSNRVTRGADDWLSIFSWKDHSPLRELKKRGYQILATRFENARPIHEINFSQPTAIIFGNEKEGVSAEALELSDSSVFVPMRGFSQSFNISVAAALVLYHVRSELEKAGLVKNENYQKYLKEDFIRRCFADPDKLIQEVMLRMPKEGVHPHV